MRKYLKFAGLILGLIVIFTVFNSDMLFNNSVEAKLKTCTGKLYTFEHPTMVVCMCHPDYSDCTVSYQGDPPMLPPG